VIGFKPEEIYHPSMGMKAYQLQRRDTGQILRKLRGPGELHESPGPWEVPKKGSKRVQTMSPTRKSQEDIEDVVSALVEKRLGKYEEQMGELLGLLKGSMFPDRDVGIGKKKTR
jgi:hypothetical protein